MLCGGRPAKRGKDGSAPVYLNVYDLTPMNGYAYWFGLGVYHSGVQVHGVEYAFGSHEHQTTGIFEGKPKQCEGFAFRKQILIGWTEKNRREVKAVMADLASDYKGVSYNLITKNCNHFCNDACVRLTGNTIPSWINRLAKIGLLCNCIIPASLGSIKVGIEDNNKVYNNEGEIRKKLKSRSRTFASSSSSSIENPPLASSSPPVARIRSVKGSQIMPRRVREHLEDHEEEVAKIEAHLKELELEKRERLKIIDEKKAIVKSNQKDIRKEERRVSAIDAEIPLANDELRSQHIIIASIKAMYPEAS